MLTRRALIGSAAATPLLWHTAFAETPRDEVVMAMRIDDIISLDPAEAFEFASTEIVANCYETLVARDEADPAKLTGVLADHWEVAGDGLTHTFHLRQDRKFASGTLVTAQDAAWSLQRAAILNKAPGLILGQLSLTKDSVADRIKATDDHTLVIKLAEQLAPGFLFTCLSAGIGSIVEKTLALSHASGDDLGNGWLRGASAGSNAWALRSWKADDGVLLEATPGAPTKLKRMAIRHLADPAAQLQQLQKGDADIVRNLGAEQLRAVQGKPDVTLVGKRLATLRYVAMNQATPELAHPDVAQAVKWAIDYEALAQMVTPELGTTHQAFVPTGIVGALDDNPFHKDVEKARALMKQAGLEKGFSVTLDHAADAPASEIAKALQTDLAAIGIQLQLLPAASSQVIAKTRARQHQMALLRWGSDYLDPHSNTQAFCVNEDNGDTAMGRTIAWRSKWQDKDLTGRAQDALKEADPTKRMADYQQLQKDFLQRAPFVMLQQQVGVAAMRKPVTRFEVGTLSDGTRYNELLTL